LAKSRNCWLVLLAGGNNMVALNTFPLKSQTPLEAFLACRTFNPSKNFTDKSAADISQMTGTFLPTFA
jgi:hypothetical protein